MIDAQNYVAQIGRVLMAHRDPERAEGQKIYMRENFDFFGLTAGQRRAVLRPYLRKESLPERSELHEIIKLLWQQPQREFQYFGQELLAKFKNELTGADLPLLEFMITQRSWWDTVDFIATHLVGPPLLRFPELREPSCDRWYESGNIWLQRTSLLFQLKYGLQLDHNLLSHQIDRLAHSKEFFICKAIGWILREYSKSNPGWVLQFVAERPGLSNLSRREALRLINTN